MAMLTRAYFAGLIATFALIAIDSTTAMPVAVASSAQAPPTLSRQATAPAAVTPPRPDSTGLPASRHAACDAALGRLLANVPVDFRAGDDDLKASANRIVAGIAEISMRCPASPLVIEYRASGALTEARAQRFARRLRAFGVPVQARAATAPPARTFVLSFDDAAMGAP